MSPSARLREMVLLAAIVGLGAWMWHSARVPPERPPAALTGDIAAHLQRMPSCHCGPGPMPTSERHPYLQYAESSTLPAGFDPAHFQLYEQRHANAYIDWWNVDEGLLRTAATGDPAPLFQAMGRIRRSVQSVLLGEVHRATILGVEPEREHASPTLAQLEEVVGSPDQLRMALREALPGGEGWLVVGVDLRTGAVVVDHPDAHATRGLWGGYPLLAIDCHRTAHLFDFGVEPEGRVAHFDCLWPQINRRAVEVRADAARRLVSAELTVTPDALVPLDDTALAQINTAALDAVRVSLTTPRVASLEDVVPAPLAAALDDLLTDAWPRVLAPWVAHAPERAVLGVVAETGRLALFHVADPAREGVWGIVPIAAFTPDQADHLTAVDWETIAERWAATGDSVSETAEPSETDRR